jgi:FdhE protein
MTPIDEHRWIARHPYLEQLATFHHQVEAALRDISIPVAGLPVWDDYRGDFLDGIPLLHSSKVSIDLVPAEGAIHSLLAKLSSRSLPGNLLEECQGFLHSAFYPDHGIVDSLLANGPFTPEIPSSLSYFGWAVLARFLAPVTEAFRNWRDEESWLLNYCPTCGTLPAMAQLAGAEPERRRLLSCGCCKTHWRYARTGCPFCQEAGNHPLTSLSVEGEAGLRIDYCEGCRGYLKTYNGEGNERLLLADWTSIHLDIVALDRGLNPYRRSLYAFASL